MPVTTGSPATAFVIRAEPEQPGGRGSDLHWLGSRSKTFSGFRRPRALFRQGVTAQVIQLNEISIHNTGTPAVSVQELKGLLHPPQSVSLQNQILTTRIVPLWHKL